MNILEGIKAGQLFQYAASPDVIPLWIIYTDINSQTLLTELAIVKEEAAKW